MRVYPSVSRHDAMKLLNFHSHSMPTASSRCRLSYLAFTSYLHTDHLPFLPSWLRGRGVLTYGIARHEQKVESEKGSFGVPE